MSGKLTHLDESGAARMVDVSDKNITTREAMAEGTVRMEPATLALILKGEAKKGDVLAAARLAGIMAAKKTHELIPLCHPLMITKAEVQFAPDEAQSLITVTVACLTIYDMCKAVDRGMRITDIRLREKSGGKSGDWRGD